MLPPPAPIDLMSISGIAAGTPHSISYSVVCRCSTVADDADVGAGAAHVERQQVRQPGLDAKRGGDQHPARRTGLRGLDRVQRPRPEASIAPPFDFMIVQGAVSPAPVSVAAGCRRSAASAA